MKYDEKVNSDEIIKVSHLTHDFGGGMGVFDVSFAVKKGEVYGFLGPNGAGKSTTIRHIMGFYKPDSGATYVNGKESFAHYAEILKDVGYLPGEPALPLSYTGKEFIREMEALKGVTDESVLQDLITYFQVDPNLQCKSMSMGMKRKMAILVAFMSDPDIFVLDEPTSGLDPQMQEKFIHFVKEEKKKGKTILLSSHLFAEVDATCDRIGIIKDGKLVNEFEADALKHNTQKTFIVTFGSDAAVTAFSSASHPAIKVIAQKPELCELTLVVDDKDINALIALLSQYDVQNFREQKETLRDYFMSFYKEDQSFKGVR
jgi:ABC-2 type transport system ATP-binding protein